MPSRITQTSLKHFSAQLCLSPTPALRPACRSSVSNRDSPNVDKHMRTNSGRELTTQKDRNKNHANKIHYCVQMYSEYKQFSEKHISKHHERQLNMYENLFIFN